MATLATAHALEKNLPVLGLYTFGSPRVGATDFKDQFNSRFKTRTFRVVNGDDIVTLVPPGDEKHPYHHIDTSIVFDNQGNRHDNQPIWKIYLENHLGKLTDLEEIKKLLHNSPVQDHSLLIPEKDGTGYIQRLKNDPAKTR